MPQKKNACPDCGELINEHTHAGIESVYFAGRELTADVRCGGCRKLVCVSGGAVAAMHTINGSGIHSDDADDGD